MATIAQLRAGLAANLATIPNVNQVSAYQIVNPTPPAIHVYPGPIKYDLAIRRGLDKLTFTVQAFVDFNAGDDSQALLDTFLAPSGPSSVKAAIEADQTLAGALTINPGENPVNVTACAGYSIKVRDNGGAVIAAEWTVEIYQPGT